MDVLRALAVCLSLSTGFAADQWVQTSTGRVKMIVTRPADAHPPLPAIFLVAWLSCDSVEYKDGETDGFGALLLRLLRQSGYAMFRTEKPGINGSDGKCSETDLNGEVAAYRAGFRAMLADPAIDKDRIFILGLSNGAAIAPLVTGDTRVRGYVLSGGWTRTWFEHMLETERKQMEWRATDASEITRRMKLLTRLYNGYLIDKQTPAQVIAAHPELQEVWHGDGAHQYGRPAAFYQQLEDLNVAKIWHDARGAPVLAIHGGFDVLMNAEDHCDLADWASQRRPGSGRFVEVPKMSHLLEIFPTREDMLAERGGKFESWLVALILDWMRAQAN